MTTPSYYMDIDFRFYFARFMVFFLLFSAVQPFAIFVSPAKSLPTCGFLLVSYCYLRYSNNS